MKHLKSYKIFENYASTSWTDVIVPYGRTTKHGKKTTITIQEIEEYLINEPIIEIPVDDIKDMSIHKDKKDDTTLSRVSASDLSFPIIITKDIDGRYNMILDGHHRLQKAINTGQEMIKAKVLDLKEAPYKYKQMFR